MSFKGKVALVTGGSRGIGRAIVLKLAEEGADVIVDFFRHRQAAEQTSAEAASKGVTARIIKAHVGDVEKIDNMFETINNDFGRLDIFINNAASGVARSALELDSQAWDWTMDINAKAFLLCAQRAARLMEGRRGKIVAISSLGSSFVWPGYAAVGVSKAALEALTRYLAIELAPKGISVNAVAASAVQTEALKLYAGKQSATAAGWQMTPAGRMVSADDVASVVAFLCSEEAYMIRGQTIIIDGGLSLTHPYSLTADLNIKSE
jgi:enoyl-[acyl-carrier protein] reductase III